MSAQSPQDLKVKYQQLVDLWEAGNINRQTINNLKNKEELLKDVYPDHYAKLSSKRNLELSPLLTDALIDDPEKFEQAVGGLSRKLWHGLEVTADYDPEDFQGNSQFSLIALKAFVRQNFPDVFDKIREKRNARPVVHLIIAEIAKRKESQKQPASSSVAQIDGQPTHHEQLDRRGGHPEFQSEEIQPQLSQIQASTASSSGQRSAQSSQENLPTSERSFGTVPSSSRHGSSAAPGFGCDPRREGYGPPNQPAQRQFGGISESTSSSNRFPPQQGFQGSGAPAGHLARERQKLLQGIPGNTQSTSLTPFQQVGHMPVLQPRGHQPGAGAGAPPVSNSWFEKNPAAAHPADTEVTPYGITSKRTPHGLPSVEVANRDILNKDLGVTRPLSVQSIQSHIQSVKSTRRHHYDVTRLIHELADLQEQNDPPAAPAEIQRAKDELIAEVAQQIQFTKVTAFTTENKNYDVRREAEKLVEDEFFRVVSEREEVIVLD